MRLLSGRLILNIIAQKAQRSINTDSVVIPVTQACFVAIDSKDWEYKVELQLKILCTLKGIPTPLDSAVLPYQCPLITP